RGDSTHCYPCRLRDGGGVFEAVPSPPRLVAWSLPSGSEVWRRSKARRRSGKPSHQLTSNKPKSGGTHASDDCPSPCSECGLLLLSHRGRYAPQAGGDGPGPRLASAGSVSRWRSTRRWRSVHRGEQLARVTQTRRLTDFPSVGRNELRKDAGGCWEVPAGGRVSEDSGVTRRAHPSAGTGRHGHGDWMVTDRCLIEGVDLLIPKAGRRRFDPGRPLSAHG